MNENKKIKRIGTLTLGICLILIGFASFLSMFIGIKILKYVLYAWPLILIFIGIEILLYSKKDDVILKYDILGLLLLGIVLVTSILSSLTFNIVDDFIKNKKEYTTYFNNLSPYINELDILDNIIK
ncbi:MAG: hypothetical protein PHR25_02540 [Clostridia bacterium]|nr:hypothetical protein [Clostridia bacterium]MDD4375637.1 hypothetical protein [Clostridia bacterium]